ncbi:extracellular solute-binding protein [Paenibacillus filicis]|uniref:Extracellular solute-binding protein n=1 Tax=Paenibacillus gyeongsangnamensis TaxID=3388067 RepID=A0ABT4Q4Q4_9BACL|nr:extracellular solute-binding protein [Paenibacillus filicis]MCZ8511675.1 extracellular solute-binding protein [Paenibacillus filicis]
MKKALLVLISILLTLSIAACSSSSSGDGEQTEPVAKKSDMAGTVRVALAGWTLDNGIDAQTGAESVGLNQFLKETFNKMYPNIKLEIYQIPWENAKAKQYAMLLSKDVDLLYTGGAYAAQWYQQGLLRDIDDLIKADSGFDPKIYLDGVWNNSYSTKSLDKTHQFGIPAVLGRRMTIYDKKLFDDWGVKPLSSKATPDEIMNAAKKMTGKNPKTGEQNYGVYWSGNSLNGSTIVGLTLAFGAKGAEGSLSDMKHIKWQLNSPEMVKVVEWLKEMAPLAPPGFVNAQGAESFGIAKNSIAIGLDQTGGTTMSDFRVNKNKDIIDRFVPAMNIGPKGESWVAVDPFIMAKDVKDEKAAWEVMKFLAGPETQKHNYKYFAYTPTLKNPDFITAEDKFVKEALKIADVAHSELMDEANPFFLSDIVPAINGYASQAAQGNAPDAKTFLDDLQKRAEAWSNNLK